jgi:hypothetical protein
VTGTAIGVLRSVPGWGHCVRARVRAYCLRWWWQTIPACQWLAVSGVHVDVAALALWLSRGPMERAMAHQRRPESGGGAGAAGEAASGYLGVSPTFSRINRWFDLACTWRCLNLCFRDPFLFVDRRGRFRCTLLPHYCHIIEAPWLVNGGHSASLRHHKQLGHTRTVMS